MELTSEQKKEIQEQQSQSNSTKRVTSVRQIDDYILPAITEQSIAFKLFALLKEKELK
jgi:hypothetical protein